MLLCIIVLTFSVEEKIEITSMWETDSKEVATHTSARHCPCELALDDFEDLVGGEVGNAESVGEQSGVNGHLTILATAQ